MLAAHCKKDDLLYCWAGSSDISGYHADIHEGHGTVGTGQGHGMAWEQHAMCESAFTAYWIVKVWVKTPQTSFIKRLNFTVQWVLPHLHICQDFCLNLGGYLPALVMSDCCRHCEAINCITLVNIRSLLNICGSVHHA